MSSKTENLKNKIIDAVKKDESNIVMTNMLVSVVKKGGFFSSDMEIQLSGRVDINSDIERIRLIVEQIAGDTPVVNNLRFKS
jgi:osmotically-inducible protein OsmY